MEYMPVSNEFASKCNSISFESEDKKKQRKAEKKIRKEEKKMRKAEKKIRKAEKKMRKAERKQKKEEKKQKKIEKENKKKEKREKKEEKREKKEEKRDNKMDWTGLPWDTEGCPLSECSDDEEDVAKETTIIIEKKMDENSKKSESAKRRKPDGDTQIKNMPIRPSNAAESSSTSSSSKTPFTRPATPPTTSNSRTHFRKASKYAPVPAARIAAYSEYFEDLKSEVTKIGKRINLPKSIIFVANKLFRQINKKIEMQAESYSVACLYIACRRGGKPHSLQEICIQSNMDKMEIMRCQKLIQLL